MNFFRPEDHFFIIDSEHLDDVKTKLYGFSVQEDGIFQNENLKADNIRGITGAGTYVFVERSGDEITLKQDFNGSYGIFLFRSGSYFAFSNSFLYLIERLKKRFALSLNVDYANHFLLAGLASLAVSETMVNEIEMIRKDAIIHIDIREKEITYEYIDEGVESISIDSREGIEVLDRWFNKWTRVFRSLAAHTSNIMTDLSGGFDSRVTFMLMLKSGVDLSKIWIHSMNDNLHTHTEDYEIASQIAKHFAFELNRTKCLGSESVNCSLDDALNISFYPKLAFHKQMYIKTKLHINKRYVISGSGGGTLRAFWNMSPESFVQQEIRCANRYSKPLNEEISKSVKKELESAFAYVAEKYLPEDPFSKKLPAYLYRETRSRNHFGKSSVELYCANQIKLEPFMDPELVRLCRSTQSCEDDNLLFAVILSRYCPELLDFKFEGGRSIEPKTISFAREINRKYPFIPRNGLDTGGFSVCTRDNSINGSEDNPPLQQEEVYKFCMEYFESNRLQNMFETHFDKEIYLYAKSYAAKTRFHSLREVFSVIAVSKFLSDIMLSQELQSHSVKQSADIAIKSNERCIHSDYEIVKRVIDSLTARIDIKTENTREDAIEIINVSDSKAALSKPAWLQKEGMGYVLTSSSGTIEIELKSNINGQIKICMRSKDIRDKSGNPTPVWIDFKQFKYNGQIIFDQIRPAWHNRPIIYSYSVKENETVKLYVEWDFMRFRGRDL